MFVCLTLIYNYLELISYEDFQFVLFVAFLNFYESGGKVYYFCFLLR